MFKIGDIVILRKDSIYYEYQNSILKVGRIMKNNNWEVFDKNGNILNNSVLSITTGYENQYGDRDLELLDDARKFLI